MIQAELMQILKITNIKKSQLRKLLFKGKSGKTKEKQKIKINQCNILKKPVNQAIKKQQLNHQSLKIY